MNDVCRKKRVVSSYEGMMSVGVVITFNYDDADIIHIV